MTERDANREPAGSSTADRALARLASRAGALKRLKRAGWLDRGIPEPAAESVADHSYRVALLAWLVAEQAVANGEALDPGRAAILALLHDLPEAMTGDLTPYAPDDVPAEADAAARAAFLDRRHRRDPVRAEAKRRAEADAVAGLARDLPPPLRDRLHAAWRELTEASSSEARLVKQVDKLETFLQSREYAARFPSLAVASFAAEVAEVIDEPRLADLRDAIAALDRLDGA